MDDDDITVFVCVCKEHHVINMVVSVCLNHAALCSWVNSRVNGGSRLWNSQCFFSRGRGF